jgi:RNA polymerase sigma factor (sigma-70 family)
MTLSLQPIVRHVRRLAVPRENAILSDAVLLQRFVTDRDQDAFAALADRHGPMVLHLCQRVLGDLHAAEDVCQASFLVLARQASSIRTSATLTGWLHAVALRMALRARSAARRRTAGRAGQLAEIADSGADPLATLSARELLVVVETEVARLPKLYRLPVLLCCIEGLSQEAAACQLGWTSGSLKGRLERGRKCLQARLARRGIVPGATLAALETARTSTVTASPALLSTTVRAALAFAGNQVHDVPISAEAVRLAGEALVSAGTGKVRLAVAILLVLGMTALGAGAVLHSPPREIPQQVVVADDPRDAKAGAKAHVDHEGVELPAEAVARIGSTRMRHSGRISAVAYSPDEKSVASLDEHGYLCFWDPATGKLQRRFRPSKDAYAGQFAFKPDGKSLVLFDNFTCRSIDVPTGKEIRSFTQDVEGFALYPTFDPSGSLLAIHSSNILRVVDVASGKERFRTPVEGTLIGSAAVAPDLKTVAVAIANKETVLLFDASSGKLLHKLQGPPNSRAGVLVFAPDGKTLFSGGDSPVFWDLTLNKVAGQVNGHYGRSCAAFSPDGKRLAFGGSQHAVLVEVPSGKEIRRLPAGNALSLAFSKDGRTLLVGAWGGDVSQWNVETGRLLEASASPFPQVNGVRFLDDRRVLISARTFQVMDWRAGTVLDRLPEYEMEEYGSADVSADRRLLAYPAAKGQIEVIDIKTSTPLRRLAGHKGGALAVRFSSNGRILFSTGWDCVVRGWDVATGKLRYEWKDHPDTPNVLVVSPDGRWVLTATTGLCTKRDLEFRVWDVQANRLARKMSLPGRYFFCFVFSPDSRLVAAGGGEGEFDLNTPGHITLFEVASGQQVGAIDGHPRPLYDLAFSPDGKCLAAADRTWLAEIPFRYWELASGKERHRFEGHTGHVHALAFSPAGGLLAAASPDAPAYVWDVYGNSSSKPARVENWSAEDRQKLWQELGSSDAMVAFQAVRRLIRNPSPAAVLCGEHLKPVKPADSKQIEQWLRDLASEDFKVRQAAFSQLEKQGDQIEQHLRQALKPGIGLEARRRMELLLEKMDSPSPQRLAPLRALEALEQIASAGATRLLTSLAAGEPSARLTREAAASLERLRKR